MMLDTNNIYSCLVMFNVYDLLLTSFTEITVVV